MEQKMYAGMNDSEIISRASFVTRWHIMPMSIKQTVAEHQYNVAMLCWQLPWNDISYHRQAAISWAMVHDLPEALIGDVPGHVKTERSDIKASLDDFEVEVMPLWWVEERRRIMIENEKTQLAVKACDLADTLRMAKYIINPAMRDFATLSNQKRFEQIIGKMEAPVAVIKFLTEYALRG